MSYGGVAIQDIARGCGLGADHADRLDNAHPPKPQVKSPSQRANRRATHGLGNHAHMLKVPPP
jgi:hypothetical protein